MRVLFAIFTIILGLFCYFERGKISSDIFAILPDFKASEILDFQRNFSQNAVILYPNKDSFLEFQRINDELLVFDLQNYPLNLQTLKEKFLPFKLALFKGELDENFLKNSAKSLFLGVKNSIFGIQDDFFSLFSQAQILKEQESFTLDLSSGFLTNGEYILAKAKVVGSPENLIFIHKKMKELGIITNSPKIFEAYSRTNGEREGLILGSLSLVLSLMFLFFAFRNFKVLWLFWVAGFGFLSGLGFSILILGEIHILVLVVGTSLIGLMLDFSACYLGFSANSTIKKSSIKEILPSFILALFISSFGYLLFLFSPMNFLHQIAIFSVFALLGAFVCSYFLLPNLLDNSRLKSFKFIDQILINLENFGLFLAKIFSKKSFKFGLFLIFLGSVFVILNSNFSDNIKNYNQASKELLEESNLVLKLTNDSVDFKFISVKRQSQKALISELLALNLISNYISLDKFFNDEDTQKKLKNDFETLVKKPEIIEFYAKFGIDLKSKFDETGRLKTYSDNELMEKFDDFVPFFKNPNLIMVKNPILNDEFYQILSKFDANYHDAISSINQGFTQIKLSAIYIKIFGFLFMFFVLILAINFKNALALTSCLLFISSLVFAFFVLVDEANIFVIFGLILGSAVGLDYMIFAIKNASVSAKIFGILTACLTSVFSFLALGFSQTKAISSFGLSVSLSLILTFIFSLYLANFKR